MAGMRTKKIENYLKSSFWKIQFLVSRVQCQRRGVHAISCCSLVS